MQYNRPLILSIAGFDPCGGAGVLADIKTFEQHKCLGMAVNTAITNQVEDKLEYVKWIPVDEIIDQIATLTERYKIGFVKIGIVENLDGLLEIVRLLKKQNALVKIVWDTVLSASVGFSFTEKLDKQTLNNILKNVHLITPNIDEAKQLSGNDNKLQAAIELASYCNVLLKGGHSSSEKGTDYLMYGGKQIKLVSEERKELFQKHGSGCILSAAITSNLALGHDLEKACRMAKKYIETILKSNHNLLAYHVA